MYYHQNNIKRKLETIEEYKEPFNNRKNKKLTTVYKVKSQDI